MWVSLLQQIQQQQQLVLQHSRRRQVSEAGHTACVAGIFRIATIVGTLLAGIHWKCWGIKVGVALLGGVISCQHHCQCTAALQHCAWCASCWLTTRPHCSAVLEFTSPQGPTPAQQGLFCKAVTRMQLAHVWCGEQAMRTDGTGLRNRKHCVPH